MSLMKILTDGVRLIGGFIKSLPKMAQLIVFGGLVIVAFLIGNNKEKSDFQKFTIEYEQFKKDANKTKVYADSLKTTVMYLQDSINKKEIIVKQLKVELDVNVVNRKKLIQQNEDTKAKLKSAQTLKDTVIQQTKIIDNLEQQLTIADTNLAIKDTLIQVKDKQLRQQFNATYIAIQRGDSLQRILLEIPSTPKDPNTIIFGIPKPSRKAIGVVAFVVGVVVGAKLKN